MGSASDPARPVSSRPPVMGADGQVQVTGIGLSDPLGFASGRINTWPRGVLWNILRNMIRTIFSPFLLKLVFLLQIPNACGLEAQLAYSYLTW